MIASLRDIILCGFIFSFFEPQRTEEEESRIHPPETFQAARGLSITPRVRGPVRSEQTVPYEARPGALDPQGSTIVQQPSRSGQVQERRRAGWRRRSGDGQGCRQVGRRGEGGGGEVGQRRRRWRRRKAAEYGEYQGYEYCDEEGKGRQKTMNFSGLMCSVFLVLLIEISIQLF